RKCFDQTDTITRWGGDEFLILSPFLHIEDVMYKVKRVEEALELNKEKYYHLSLSTGLSIYPTDAESFEELLSLADHKMYRQKSEDHMLREPLIQNRTEMNPS